MNEIERKEFYETEEKKNVDNNKGAALFLVCISVSVGFFYCKLGDESVS